MTSVSLIFCHSLCGLNFFLPNLHPSFVPAKAPLHPSTAKLSVVTTNLITFQFCSAKPKERDLPVQNKHTRRIPLLKSETLRVVVFVSPQLQFSLPLLFCSLSSLTGAFRCALSSVCRSLWLVRFVSTFPPVILSERSSLRCSSVRCSFVSLATTDTINLRQLWIYCLFGSSRCFHDSTVALVCLI